MSVSGPVVVTMSVLDTRAKANGVMGLFTWLRVSKTDIDSGAGGSWPRFHVCAVLRRPQKCFAVLSSLPSVGVTILGQHAFITYALRVGKHIKDREAGLGQGSAPLTPNTFTAADQEVNVWSACCVPFRFGVTSEP